MLFPSLIGWHMSDAQIYTASNVNVSFFSSAPIENIDAKTNKGISAINISTNVVYFKVPVNTFQFKKKLMQEHFNENYLETDKYPVSEFNGKVSGDIDYTKNGVYPVVVEGTLSIHGVTKTYKEKGEIRVDNNGITAIANFDVRLEHHQIKIPRVVIKNIAEVVQVKVNALYQKLR